MFSTAPRFADAITPPLAARKAAFAKWVPTIAPGVTALDLTDRALNDKHLAALNEWSGLSSLRCLRLANNNVKSEAVASVLRTCSESLEVLDLSATKVKADIIPLLAELPWPRLHTLILDHTNLKNAFGDAQLNAPQLTTLSVREAGLNASAAKGLLAQDFLHSLTTLLVDFNALGKRGIADILGALVDHPLQELRIEMADQPAKVLQPFFAAKARSAMTRLDVPWDFPEAPNLDAFTGLQSLKLGCVHGDILAHPVLQSITTLTLSTLELAPVSFKRVTHVDLGIGQFASESLRAGAAKWLESFAGSAVTALDVVYAPDDDALFDAAAPLCSQLLAARFPLASPSRFAAWVQRSPQLQVLALEDAHHNADAPAAREDVINAAADLADLRRVRLVLDEDSPTDALRAFAARRSETSIELRPFVETDFATHDTLVDALGAKLIFDEDTPLQAL